MSEDIKPCPFCGSSSIKYSTYMSSGCMECNNCGAIGPDNQTDDCDENNIEKAEAAWNKRADN